MIRHATPNPRHGRLRAPWMLVPLMALALVGCAQKRPALLGGLGGGGMRAARPEPGLQIQAPMADVQLGSRSSQVGTADIPGAIAIASDSPASSPYRSASPHQSAPPSRSAPPASSPSQSASSHHSLGVIAPLD